MGTSLGHDDDGTLAGVLAACSALAGIVAAKILIIVFILLPLPKLTREFDSVEIQRQTLIGLVAEQRIEPLGLPPDKDSEQQWADAETAAEDEVAKPSDSQVTPRLAVREAPAATEPAAEQGSPESRVAEPALAPVPPAEERPRLAEPLFKSIFTPIDGIFILLAVATAFKIGSGSRSE